MIMLVSNSATEHSPFLLSEISGSVSGGDAVPYSVSSAELPDYTEVLQEISDDQVLLLEETQEQTDILIELMELFSFNEAVEALSDKELTDQKIESVSGGDAGYYLYSSEELPDYTKMFQKLADNQQLIINEFQTQTEAVNEQTEQIQQGFVMLSIFLGLIAGMLFTMGLWSGRR